MLQYKSIEDAYNAGYQSGRIGVIMDLVVDNELSIEQASNYLKISETEFENMLKRNMTLEQYKNMILVPLGGRPTKYTPELASELSTKYKIMTIQELSGLYNVSVRTMQRWLKQAGISKNNRRGIDNMVLADTNKLTINIKPLKEQMVLLYFSGDDTYLNKDIIKSMGFGYTSSPVINTQSWQLIIPVSSLSDKIDLIREHFPTITIIKQ